GGGVEGAGGGRIEPREEDEAEDTLLEGHAAGPDNREQERVRGQDWVGSRNAEEEDRRGWRRARPGIERGAARACARADARSGSQRGVAQSACAANAETGFARFARFAGFTGFTGFTGFAGFAGLTGFTRVRG